MQEESAEVATEKPSKRKLSKEAKSEKSPGQKKHVKKAKLFSAKEFRRRLSEDDRLSALKQFLEAIRSSDGHDYVFDYLDNGGNCLELLQILENDSTIAPSLIFELVTHLLLKIRAMYTDYENSAYEACRYLINNYISVVHKMLGLSSTKEERKACLKLLTAMVTFSPNLAKDVLLNVKFHSANIELLSKHTQEKNSVRDYFIHFLTGFLIDGHEHILSIILEKSGLLTSIVSGLQYDVADTVCVVLTAMKNHILENVKVSRTMKMSVFNTSVIRDIVNLYNWRGPDGLKMLEKNNKTVFEVDKYEKSKVSECVHDFLIVLCTSHKFGVIFKDPLVGLGRKNQNALIYTVLESLSKPWEHSYASDLVLNICRACPDMTKTTWTNLKTFLEPRLSEKWFTTLAFARKLLQLLEPKCIDYCAKTLSPQQLAQIIELLVLPLPILKTLLPQDNKYETPSIKQHISVFLLDMLQAIKNYLEACQFWTNVENCQKIKNHLASYVSKNFPNARTLLSDWKELSEEIERKFEYLACILDILNLYQTLAPPLLHDLSPDDLNLKDLLQNLPDSTEEIEILDVLQVKIVSIFLDLDQTFFLPQNEMFEYTFPLLLKLYHKNKSKDIFSVLSKVLRNTNIFEESISEINIWCNGILNLDTLTDSFGEKLVKIIKDTCSNILEFHKELSDIQVEHSNNENFANILEDLLNMGEDSDSIQPVKHRNFSPFVLGVLKDIQNSGSSKGFKKYLDFTIINMLHFQTNPSKFKMLMENYKECVSDDIFEYIENWCSGQPIHLQKFRGTLNIFQTFSEQFLTMNLDEDIVLKPSPYINFKLDILQASVFYFYNLTSTDSLLGHHIENFKMVVKHLCGQNELGSEEINRIFNNPNSVKNFDILHLSKDNSICDFTKTLSDIVKEIKHSGIDIDSSLKTYRYKIYNSILKIVKKPTKYSVNGEILDILNVFQLYHNQAYNIISTISTSLSENSNIAENTLLDVLCYCIHRISDLSKHDHQLIPLEKNHMNNLTYYFGNLAQENKNINKFSAALKHYLEIFPHNISDVEESFFTSVMRLTEYDKENVDLLVFLFERKSDLKKWFEPQIEFLIDKKGVFLPLTNVLIQDKNDNSETLENIYKVLEPSIMKAIQKPQKVGQHFQKDNGIAVLVEKYMDIEKCKSYVEKLQKFEVVELFHVKLLEAVFNKIIEHDLCNTKVAGNIILTFVHLEMNVFKRKCDEDNLKINKITEVFCNLLNKIKSKIDKSNLLNVAKNETFKTFTKFCLKFGVSGQCVLLKCLKILIEILSKNLENEYSSLVLEMLLSHSGFLDVVLGEHTDTKFEVLSIVLVLCTNWTELMEKNHIPILLSAYRAKITRCDKTILALLKLYESKAEQTRFYDFKPFLWGRAAATHYSVRSRIENSLIRQPKTGDVLNLIKEDLVRNTIKSYPFTSGLCEDIEDISGVEEKQCYDLMFMLPLFSHLLAPEQEIKTYKFTRSGALSLTVVGLSSSDKHVRQAACHVLSRLHFHLEARQTGKDNLLWIRYVEALCKGLAVLPNFKANNFAAVFFARMALVFTQPNHVMYQPLARYLSAKEELHLDTVPELYTLLHSPEVNFNEHRCFILKVLKDGVRNSYDFKDFSRSMGFKLISELFNSCLSDGETKLLIFEVIEACCALPLGIKVLCENHSLVTQIDSQFCEALLSRSFNSNLFAMYLNIYLKIVDTRKDLATVSPIFDTVFNFVSSECFARLNPECVKVCYEILYKLFNIKREFFSIERINRLINISNDKFCKYVQKYGCEYILGETLKKDNQNYYLQLLILKFFHCKL